MIFNRISKFRPLSKSISASSSRQSLFSNWTFPSKFDSETPAFIVSPQTGFLPRNDPPRLPPSFKMLTALLTEMSLELPDGKPGLLAQGKLGEKVDKLLPLYNVDDITDQELLMALFRDYTFLTSAYLLEPCDIMNRAKGTYRPGRQKLPRQLAVPLAKISEKIKAKPFMEYAQSYALYNYERIDPEKTLEYDNLQLIRKFSGLKSEHGFILIHVAMVRHTPKLVSGVIDALKAVAAKDHKKFNKSLELILSTMQDINDVMQEMWTKSLPEDYIKFRTFIMGIKDQAEMFPNGVIYEGVDPKPRFYRGESGANDSIIPTMDNFLQITGDMPNNPMTDILRDFRTYRPAEHSRWLEWVDKSANQVGVAAFAEKNPQSIVLYLELLDQVRDFRNRHWLFAKEYIIKRSNYPRATGGSPMATWLGNQLKVIYTAIDKCGKKIKKLGINGERINEIIERAAIQNMSLEKDVELFKKKYENPNPKK